MPFLTTKFFWIAIGGERQPFYLFINTKKHF